MSKSVQGKAQEQFTAAQKKNKELLNEKEKERQAMSKHVASLRALRLGKEAADKKAAKDADIGKPAAKRTKH